MKWIVRDYVGNDWPLIKSDGIELECAGATRVQAEAIAVRLNAHEDLVKALEDLLHNSNPPYSGNRRIDADFERRYREASEKALDALAKAGTAISPEEAARMKEVTGCIAQKKCPHPNQCQRDKCCIPF